MSAQDNISEAAEPPVEKTYTVNGTVSMAAWITVTAESEDDALEQADQISPSDWYTDPGTAQIERNVTPMVEVEE